MSLYKQYKNNDKKESDGVPVKFGDATITIARAGGGNKRMAFISQESTNRIEELQSEVLKLSDNDDPTEAEMEKLAALMKESEGIMVKYYANAVVLGWKGVEDEDGNTLEFTKSNVVKVLTDLPEVLNEIKEKSSSLELFRDKKVKKTKKR